MRLSEIDRGREYLIVRGRLDRDDVFVPRRCGSTRSIHTWPEAQQPDHGDVVVETVDREGEVRRTERPEVVSELVCAPGFPTWRVNAYIALDEDASQVRLRRGDRVLWVSEIGEEPEAWIDLVSLPVRGEPREGRGAAFPGGEPAVVAVGGSGAVDEAGAYAKVVYRWGENLHHMVYLGPAEQKVEIAADRLPGGERCEFFVVYSNGVRSAAARTEPFSVAPIGPVVTIVHPADDDVPVVGAPLELECLVQDPEAPSAPYGERERIVWLVDGEEVAAGAAASVGPLAEGEHSVEVVYAGREKERVAVGRTISVRGADAAPADEWPEIDPFAL